MSCVYVPTYAGEGGGARGGEEVEKSREGEEGRGGEGRPQGFGRLEGWGGGGRKNPGVTPRRGSDQNTNKGDSNTSHLHV